jgi:hypothetical protein
MMKLTRSLRVVSVLAAMVLCLTIPAMAAAEILELVSAGSRSPRRFPPPDRGSSLLP